MRKTTKNSNYYIQDRAKKRQLISFRRWLAGLGDGGSVKKHIGAERYFVTEWIERKFIPGMTWENYRKDWVVGHIVPLMLFDVTKDSELKICWNYKNLMPLFKKDNLKKEGNVFFSFELLIHIKPKDFFYEKLIERIRPEVETMIQYIEKY